MNAFSLIFVFSTRMPSTPVTTTTRTSATNGVRGVVTGTGGATRRRPGLARPGSTCSGVASGAAGATAGWSAALPLTVYVSCSSMPPLSH